MTHDVDDRTRREWSARLRKRGSESLEGTVFLRDRPVPSDDAHQAVAAFRDDAGHRRPVDRPFLSHVLGVVPRRDGTEARATPDVELWWRVAEGIQGWPAWISPTAGPAPLLGRTTGIVETLTESELSAVHAAWWLARRAADPPAAQARVLLAARWIVENLQPDNATNHPWAIHVMVELHRSTGRPEPELYAQTLLHNCMVHLARPDRFSALILLDAAKALDRGVSRWGCA